MARPDRSRQPPGVGGDSYGDDMDVEALERFVIAAKAATYVSGGATVRSSRPGSHDLSFTDGDWTYLDSYFGGQDFLGQEVVWYRGEPAWAMNYYGWITAPDQIDAVQAGRVIMAALSGLYEQRRFLGGHDARVDGWEYHDRSDGDVAHFTGREWISDAGSAPVYELVYHGGLVRPGPA